MFRRHFYVLALLSLIVWMVVSDPCEACPTCRQGLADGNHDNMVRGYFWSIVFMMSMPFLIFGGLGTYFYLQVVRARAAQAAGVAAVRGGSYSSTEAEQPADTLVVSSVGRRTTNV